MNAGGEGRSKLRTNAWNGRPHPWVPAFAEDDGYVVPLVLPRVQGKAAHLHTWVPAFAGVSVFDCQGFQVAGALVSTHGVPRRAMACNCRSSFRITATNATLPGLLAFLAGCRNAPGRCCASDKPTRLTCTRPDAPYLVRPDGPVAPLPAAVTGPGSQAHQRGQTLAVTFAQLRQVRRQDSRGEYAHALNTLVKGRPPGQLRAALQGLFILLVQPGDFAIQPGYVPFGGGPAAFRDPFVKPVEFLHPLVDQLTPAPQQSRNSSRSGSGLRRGASAMGNARPNIDRT